MTEADFLRWLLWVWFALSAVVFVALMFITAPYGRHARPGWGATVPAKLGWIIMELPSVAFFAAMFFLGQGGVAAIAFFVIWEFHYVHRTFVFPLRMRGAVRAMPLMIMLSGFVFNMFNAYLNGRYVFALRPMPAAWLADPRFIAGVLLFVVGFVINYQSDAILRNLRRPGETGYRIPYGGLYRWISCPNYFGELLEWAGWALATWSLPGLAFFLWTAANLVPRAISNHRWYREKFVDYPAERKAILPWIW